MGARVRVRTLILVVVAPVLATDFLALVDAELFQALTELGQQGHLLLDPLVDNLVKTGGLSWAAPMSAAMATSRCPWAWSYSRNTSAIAS